MLIDELHKKKHLIASIAKKYGAEDIRVFGSVASKKETKDSDIDILVSLKQGYDMFKQRIPLQQELEELFQKKIDLSVKHELNKHIRNEILSTSKEI